MGKEFDDSRGEEVAGLKEDMARPDSWVEVDREVGTALEDKGVAVHCSSLAEEEELGAENTGFLVVVARMGDGAG